MTDGPVLFCTDDFWDRRGDELRRIDPSVEAIPLVGEGPVDADDVRRIDTAFFSADAWPSRPGAFFKVCVEAERLAWLHTMSAGVDAPIFTTLMERGVTLTTSSGASAAPIARTVMMYLLALSRDLPGWLRAQAERRWEPREFAELEGRTIGVVGMGPIGLEVVRLASVFGMRPIGLRRSVRGDEPCETWTLDRLHELASVADVLVLAVPLTPDTEGLVDASVFSAMRPGSLLVNVARGPVVDEPALVDALSSGHLGGAGLDVFTVEPLPEDSPLWTMPNVIVTPHASGTSDRTAGRADDVFVDNFARRTRGEPLRNVANPTN